MASWDSEVNIQPDFGATKTLNPKTVEVVFGDGYVKNLSFGLNQNLATWNISFTNITTTEGNTIDNFLKARKGVETFDWTAPNESSSSKYRCKSWSISIPYANTANVRATFIETAIP